MMGQYENALDNARKAVQLDPDSASGYSNVGFAYAGLNRLDEAKATFNEALQHKAGAVIAHSSLAIIAWLQGDQDGTERELDAMKNDPQGEFQVTGLRSAMAAYAGQVKAGAELRTEAERSGRTSWLQGSCGQRIFARSVYRGHFPEQGSRPGRCSRKP